MSVLRVTVGISGLGYRGEGVPAVQTALGRLDGMVRAYVDPDTEMAYVVYDPGTLTLEAIEDAIRAAGYGLEEELRA